MIGIPPNAIRRRPSWKTGIVVAVAIIALLVLFGASIIKDWLGRVSA
jgi:hypothetical protein